MTRIATLVDDSPALLAEKVAAQLDKPGWNRSHKARSQERECGNRYSNKQRYESR